ncbi:hypothetical protein BS78_07G125100 [Paspalum vaginatum]|nr:hypothetical protein BS78_07G125100 [Paspalum vaginatum]
MRSTYPWHESRRLPAIQAQPRPGTLALQRYKAFSPPFPPSRRHRSLPLFLRLVSPSLLLKSSSGALGAVAEDEQRQHQDGTELRREGDPRRLRSPRQAAHRRRWREDTEGPELQNARRRWSYRVADADTAAAPNNDDNAKPGRVP